MATTTSPPAIITIPAAGRPSLPTPPPPPPLPPPIKCTTCSLSCPEFCPPPPPFPFPYQYSDDPTATPSPSSSPSFSPLLIALISILAAAFLLVSYYALCSSSFFRRRSNSSPPANQNSQSQTPDPNSGLDESLINRIALLKYRKGDGLIVSTDCSVCLGEFREEENLRLLPECTHAFHVECIDRWLESHSNCPICRTSVVSAPQPVQARVALPPRQRENQNSETVANDNNGGVGNVSNRQTPVIRERDRGNGGLVVIVDPGQVGRVEEIIELGDELPRSNGRQHMIISREIRPGKANLR